MKSIAAKVVILLIMSIMLVDLFLWGVLVYIDYSSDWEGRADLWQRDSILGWFNKPDIDMTIKGLEFSSHYTSDSMGYRYSGESEADSVILFIGDSFVQAAELDNEHVFTYRLQQESEYRIINAGVRGYCPCMEYLLLERICSEENSIKRVYVFFYINDLREIYEDNLETPFPSKPACIKENGSLKFINLPVRQKSYIDLHTEHYRKGHGLYYHMSNGMKNLMYQSSIYNIIAGGIQYTEAGAWLYRKNLMRIPVFMSYDWELVSDRILNKGMPAYKSLLLKYRELAEMNGFQLVFFLLPAEFQYDSKLASQIKVLHELYGFNADYDSVYNEIESFMTENAIRHIYPLAQFTEYNEEEPISFRFDKHLNSRGHELLYQLLSADLRDDQ